MPQQLPLPLQHALGYRGKSFIVHNGVAPACDEVQTALNSKNFALVTLVGAKLTGKTHLGVWIDSVCAERNSGLSWVEGANLENVIDTLKPNQPLFVDDISLYFKNIQPGFSGPFVRLCESFRHAGQKMFFSCSVSFEDLPCDDHVMSRLKAGAIRKIDNPSDEHMEELVDCMARQRGIEIAPSRVKFLARRVGHSIESIDACLEHLAREVFTGDEPVVFESIERAITSGER